MTTITANPVLSSRRLRTDLANPSTGASSANAVGTIAQLRALAKPGTLPGGVVLVTIHEHTTGTGKGGGAFRWDAASTAADDNGRTVNPTGNPGAGRWLRQDQQFTVEQFGAVGDGATDDQAAINAAYSAARSAGAKIVELSGSTYRCTRGINATSVSTFGNGATFDFLLSSAVDTFAFRWGGDDVTVTGCRFLLSNSNTETAMQGVLNNVSNVKRQRFFGNYVLTRTFKAAGTANIYGPWYLGYGMEDLWHFNNYCEKCFSGIQINAQDTAPRDVNTNPLGNPHRNIFIHDNTFLDCALAINTPHVFCYNANIHNNIVRLIGTPTGEDIPLNIAHVTNVAITANQIECNNTNVDGLIHVEDVSQRVVISGNTLRCLAKNIGILLLGANNISGDDPPTEKMLISGNMIYGFDQTGTINNNTGILLADSQTRDTVITGNLVQNFYYGIAVTSNNSITSNTVTDCAIGVRLVDPTAYINENVFKRCASIAENGAAGVVTISGGTINGDTFSFTKNGAGVFALQNVTFKRITNTTLTAGVPFDLCPLPATYQFDTRVTVTLSGQGFSKATIVFDGTTFTGTRIANAQIGTLGGLTFSKSGALLQASSVTASGTTLISVRIDDLVF